MMQLILTWASVDMTNGRGKRRRKNIDKAMKRFPQPVVMMWREERSR